MKRFVSLLTGAAAVVLLPLAAGAATLVIPAAGTGPGANNSQWKSDVTFHNTGSTAITATLVYHDQSGADATPSTLLVPSRATVTVRDIVRNSFNRESGTGAIEIKVDDAAARRLAVTSRTFNTSASGEFGQDIPAENVSDAALAGDLVVLQAPSDAAANRFNIGFYAVTDSTVNFELVHADGIVDGRTPMINLKSGTQTQVNDAVSSLFSRAARNDDTIHLFVVKGSVLGYGSAVNNATGDPTFVPGIDTHHDIQVNFLGVDLDENGTVDIRDANHDGVLDAPVDLYTSGFPNFFRIVIDSTEKPTFEIVDSTRDAILADDRGTVEWGAPADKRGTTTSIKVKVTVGGVSDIITIPANIK